MSTLHNLIFVMASARMVLNELSLVRRPVAVLPKYGSAILGDILQRNKCIAYGKTVYGDWRTLVVSELVEAPVEMAELKSSNEAI